MPEDCFSGHLAVEWHEDRPVRVPTVNFNFASLDRVENQVSEAVAAGRLMEWLERFAAARIQEARTEAAHAILAEVIDAKNPKQTMIFLGLACGFAVALEKTDSEWAEILGVTKQDVQQGKDHFTKKLRLRKTRAMRDEEAREQMRLSNFHPTEK